MMPWLPSILETISIKKAIILITVIGSLVYFNSLSNGFVWDDHSQIIENERIHSIKNFFHFFSLSTFSTQAQEEAYYKPFLSTTFSLLYTLFGQNSFVFHFPQILLHISNAILVFLFFNFFFSRTKSFFSALIFLIHPINTESVSYISAMQEVLFFLFGMGGLLLIQKNLRGIIPKIAISILLLLSLLSKESGLFFLLIAGVYVFIFLRRSFLHYLLISFVSLGIYLFLRLGIAGFYFTRFGDAPIQEASLIERLVSIPKIIFFYLKTFLLPFDLAISLDWVVHSINLSDFYLPLLFTSLFFSVLVGMGIFVWKKNRESTPIFVFFFLWFILGLGLHLQIFPLDMTVAERWFYFPMVGLLGIVATVIQRVNIKNEKLKVSILAILLVILAVFSLITIIRNFNWKDNMTLFSHDIKISRESPDLENNLGAELYKVENYEKAEIHFQNSLKFNQNNSITWYNLGTVYDKKGDIVQAKESYKKSIEYGELDLAYAKLANLIYLNETATETQKFTKSALVKQPNNAQLWLVLALVEYEMRNREQALIAAQKAHELSPTQDSVYILKQIEQNLPIY
ncbi:tetratricopeptide repeat protein [Candidatus Microgenomates bacterium]|nr:tetratricopeptide repeat protein [Candidatus Microgenomates bacterium]